MRTTGASPRFPAVHGRAASTGRPALGVVRFGLLALGALGILGAGTELASHGGLEHLAPWAGIAMLVASLVLFAVPLRHSTIWIRVLCLVVLGAAAYSVAEHLLAAGDPAGIDEGIADYWASLSPITRSWYGAGDAGSSTPLAPGMLGQAALLLLLATLGRRTARTTV